MSLPPPPVGRFVVFVMYSQHFQWTFIAEKKDHYTYTIAMYKPQKKQQNNQGPRDKAITKTQQIHYSPKQYWSQFHIIKNGFFLKSSVFFHITKWVS